MKRRFSLWLKISIVAFLNIALLLALFLVVARLEFRLDLNSFLLTPARERLLSTSHLVALELPNIPREQWDGLLAKYAATYPAELFIFDRNGNQLAGKPAQPPASLFPPRPHEPDDFHPHELPPFERQHRPPDRQPPPIDGVKLEHTERPSLYWVSVHTPARFGSARPPYDIHVVWRFHSLWTNPFFFDFKPWLITVALVLLVSVACWLPLIRSLTRSISAMTTATGQIAEGNFGVRLPIKRSDELGSLSQSINQMTESLSGHVNGQRRFLGDIAHELCSPVARIQMSLGILQHRSNEAMQPYVATIDEEVQHMSSLVNELLSFSKASLGASQPLQNVNVREAIARAVERERTDQSTIRVDVPDHLIVLAQPDYLFRAISNVLRNAIRYAGYAGPIEVSARVMHLQAIITVADNGPGVPVQELNEILKPFYRPEAARQRETGGVGLGLAIVRTCMEACGGSVTCRNRAPQGFEVELQVPMAQPTST